MDVTAAVFTSSEVKARTKNHPDNLVTALRSSLKEKDVIEIIASSGARILFNKKLLVLFSRTIRQCLAELPCCEAPTSITLVDINIRALKKVKEVLENNVHDVATKSSQDDIEEVVEAARALGIEMSNVKVSATMENTKIKRNKSMSKAPQDSLQLSRYSSLKTSVSTANMAPVPDNIMENDQDMSYDGERPLEISVDVSSDEDDFDDEDTEEYDTALEGTIFSSNRSEATLLNDDLENLDEEESLQEKTKLDSDNVEKISFSFLSGIDSTNTSTEIPKKLNIEPKTDHNTAALIEDNLSGPAVFRDQSLSEETEPLPSGSEETELKLRCDLCGRPQRGPSALREHYSITHFFEELFQEYVVTSESHTVCRMDGCDKDYRDRKCLVRHIGSTHNKVMEILERNGIKIPTTDHRVGSNKRRKSENLAEARSVKIKMEQTETADSANKSLSRIHQCDECEKYFSSKHNMERHQKKIHNRPGVETASGSQFVKEESG